MQNFAHVWHEWTRQVEDLRSQDGIPGMALAMIENRTRARTKSVGVRDSRTGQPVTGHTLFHIASTQKSMTALFIATLVDEGLFTWDTPMSEVVPQFRLGDDSVARDLTMRHLLGMCGGIPAEAEDDFVAQAMHAEDLFDFLMRVRPSAFPGERFDYSNLSYAAAGYCGVIADGGKWGQLEAAFACEMKRRILDPIGMSDAIFSADEFRTSADFAVPHAEGSAIGDEVAGQPDPLVPAGGLYASIHDMARYLATQLNDGLTPEGRRIVSEVNLHQTWTSQIQTNGDGYGMGWEVDHEAGMTILFHEGSFAGYLALLAMVPSLGTGIALMANMDQNDGFAGEALDQWTTLLGL